VSSEKRQRLIQLIELEKMGIKEASQRLGLNYSTAKSILRKYRHTGKILSLKNEFLNDYEKIYLENERLTTAARN
jgi:transposase